MNEVAANGLRHGRPPVKVVLWQSPTHLMCDVTDRGTGITDPFAGYTPPDPLQLLEGGAGLWMTRRLCHDVTTGRTPTGFTVRLTVAGAFAAAAHNSVPLKMGNFRPSETSSVHFGPTAA